MTTTTPTAEPGTEDWAARAAARATGNGAYPYVPSSGEAVADPLEADLPEPDPFTKLVDGGRWLFDSPDEVPAVWGKGQEVAWADGEALMLVGPAGVGKTTLAGQLVRARLGLADQVLGWPVATGEGRVLYLAMDRPRQAARAHRRLYNLDERPELAARLIVWAGPPPYDLARRPDTLVRLAEAAAADTIVVDSLKDGFIGLTDDEASAAYNRGRQLALVAGVQLIELHHQRKNGANGGRPTTLADVYGSTWITAGAGSVLLLWGTPGDAIVDLVHLKQPSGDIGPVRIIHDSAAGTSDVHHQADLLAVAARHNGGLTAKLAATAIFETLEPDRNQVEKARRRLDALVREGHLTRTQYGARGGAAGGGETTYGRAELALLDAP